MSSTTVSAFSNGDLSTRQGALPGRVPLCAVTTLILIQTLRVYVPWFLALKA